MARFATRVTVAAAASVMAAAVGSGSASATTPDAATYGQHVVECTQTMGFDQVHNTGMHLGFTGWESGHTY